MGNAEGRLRIKMCGQTSLADSEVCAAAGADLVGVVLFRGSKRYVAFGQAAEWIKRVRAGVERVAVLVDPAFEEVRAALGDGLFDSVQLHGSEGPEFVAALNEAGFGRRIIKALRVEDASSIAALDLFPTRRFLLDGPAPGSGRTFDWAVAAAAVARRPDASFLLAGGLTAENVAEAARVVRPHGVDVASGVEASPGVKDPARVRDFVAAVRGVGGRG